MTASSTYSMPRSAKKSTSFVNAAFITFGAPATIGHDVLSCVFATKDGTCVMHGKNMYSNLLRGYLWNSRLWMCACATFEG